MAKSNGIYVAAAPLALLLIAGVGAHFLPILLGDNKAEADETSPAVFHPSKHPSVPRPAPTPLPKVDQKTQAALEKAVSGQIAAFHRNDFDGALTFSAPRYRTLLTSDNFRTMISTSYPGLMNAVTQSFQPAHGNKFQAMIPVFVASNDGIVTRYMYVLGNVDGAWFIMGCSPMGPFTPEDPSNPTRRPRGPNTAVAAQG